MSAKKTDMPPLQEIIRLLRLCRSFRLIARKLRMERTTVLVRAAGFARAGHSVAYVSAHGMLSQLRATRADQSLDRRMQRFTAPDLLIVDDLGLRRLDRDEPIDLYEVIRARDERGSVMVTSNPALEEWYPPFLDDLVASAAMDRLLHHPTWWCSRGTPTGIRRVGNRSDVASHGRTGARSFPDGRCRVCPAGRRRSDRMPGRRFHRHPRASFGRARGGSACPSLDTASPRGPRRTSLA